MIGESSANRVFTGLAQVAARQCLCAVYTQSMSLEEVGSQALPPITLGAMRVPPAHPGLVTTRTSVIGVEPSFPDAPKSCRILAKLHTKRRTKQPVCDQARCDLHCYAVGRCCLAEENGLKFTG